ncbi:MAG: hypothetical protein QMD01_04270 [Thermodesulfovibrionales bacterium]|nr:hypothetical protein [Thermodesulfovibrionales bacterium]
MNKSGFIDISSYHDSDEFSLYIFRSSGAGYEFEDSLKCSWNAGLDMPVVKEFYLSLPLDALDFRILSLPFSDREKLENIIPLEMESLIMNKCEDIVFDFIILNNSGNTFDILVAYVEKKYIRELLSRFLSINIDPKIITSIELQEVSGDVEKLTSRLLDPAKMQDNERIEAAKKEIMAHSINLRKGEFAYKKDREAIGKTLRVTSILALLLSLIINSDFALRIISSKTEASSIKRQMRKEYLTIFPGGDKIIDELYQIKAQMKYLRGKDDALKGVKALGFLLELSKKMPPGIALSEINIERDVVIIKGDALRMNVIDSLKANLSELMNEVSISDIKTSHDNKILFTVVAKTRQ